MPIIQTPTAVYFVVLGLATQFMLASLCTSVYSAERLESAFAMARRAFREFETIEFEQAKVILGRPQRLKYIIKRDKFRTELTLDAEDPGKLPTQIVAYDGTHHQTFNETRKLLGFSRQVLDPMPGGLTVITVPFLWLREPRGGLLVSDIRDSKTWERVRPASRVIGEQNEGGMHYLIIEVPHPDRTFRVYMASGHGYYPLKWEAFLPDGALAGSATVAKWRTHHVDGQNLIVPLVVQISETGNEKSSLAKEITLSVDAATLRLNHPVEDDVFTIPRSRADEIVDVDARVDENRAPHAPAGESASNNKNSSSVLFVSLSLVGIAFAAAVLAWFLRRN